MEFLLSPKEQVKSRLEDLFMQGKEFIIHCPEAELSKKPTPEKWSKKEILGHLIDSASITYSALPKFCINLNLMWSGSIIKTNW
jgi:hypothetical protein